MFAHYEGMDSRERDYVEDKEESDSLLHKVSETDRLKVAQERVNYYRSVTVAETSIYRET